MPGYVGGTSNDSSVPGSFNKSFHGLPGSLDDDLPPGSGGFGSYGGDDFGDDSFPRRRPFMTIGDSLSPSLSQLFNDAMDQVLGLLEYSVHDPLFLWNKTPTLFLGASEHDSWFAAVYRILQDAHTKRGRRFPTTGRVHRS